MDGIYRRQRHLYDPLRKLFLCGRDRLLAQLDVPPGGRVLEIGCGTARNLIVLSRRRPDIELYGLDASAEMLATAAAKLRRRRLDGAVHLRHGLAEQVRPASFGLATSFDAVFFSYSLTMIGDGCAALDAALSSLKPGGTLAIVDFWDQADWPGWVRRLLQGWLARFHVRFRAETLEHLWKLADERPGTLHVESILRRYAFLAVWRDSAGEVLLRDVDEEDLPVFFEHQRDPAAIRMAAFQARDRDAFMTHWRRNVLGDGTVVKKTVLFGDLVAGNIVCYERSGRRLVGYWLGREFWGKGIATRALSEFLAQVKTRPLDAYVAKHNVGSIRVLQKCGFTVSGEASTPGGDGGAVVEELVFTLPA